MKSTVLASLVGAALASFIALQPAAQPGQATTPTGYAAILGGIVAVSMLIQRRVKFWIIAVAMITAAILSGAWWGILGAVHAAQWAGAADAGLCPIAGVAVAWLLTLIPSRAAPALTALVVRSENGWDVSWSDGRSLPRLSAATLTEVTDQAAAVAARRDLRPPASANDADFQIALFPHDYTKGLIFDISGGPGAFTATDKFSGRMLNGATLEDLLQAAEAASDLRAGEYMFHWTRPVTALSPGATATGLEPAS